MPESIVCEHMRSRGVACVEVDGWLVPEVFGDAEAEYDALRRDAALIDLAFRSRLRVTGSDRIDFLQGMLTNDIKMLAEGRGCPALLLTEQGKVTGEFVVLALPDAILLDGMTSGLTASAAALQRYIVADDVEIAPLGEAEHTVGLYGPAAPAVLERLGIGAPPARDWAFDSYVVSGVPVRVVRVPTPGSGGFHVHVAEESVADWWARCLRVGVRPAGQRAFDTLRIESGVPWVGRDVTPDTLALEAPFDEAISTRKGCYLGQEVVERVTARGRVNRRLVGLAIEGRDLPLPGDRLYDAEHDAGYVTSAAWSWRLARPIALAYIRREHWAPGTVLQLRTRAGGAGTTATVQALPLG